jgi:hypothetical protein
VEEFSAGIPRVIDTEMEKAVRVVSVERGMIYTSFRERRLPLPIPRITSGEPVIREQRIRRRRLIHIAALLHRALFLRAISPLHASPASPFAAKQKPCISELRRPQSS